MHCNAMDVLYSTFGRKCMGMSDPHNHNHFAVHRHQSPMQVLEGRRITEQICGYTDMQICRYADMQICRYADLHKSQVCPIG